MSRVTSPALALGIAIALCGTTFAQSGALLQLYGQGVHRFNAGDLSGAEQLFTQVINYGSQDPRPYFFRGLVRERMGGGGQFDFEQGARLEASGTREARVGVALMRVQGHVRAKIEKARRDARVAYAQQRAMMLEAQQNTMAAPQVVAPADGTAPPTPSMTTEDPFGDGGMRSDETTEDAQAADPAQPEIDDSTVDPFGDDPAPDSGDATTEDPFGGELDGGDMDDGTDPFGGDAGGDAGDSSDDIFGGSDDPFGTDL